MENETTENDFVEFAPEEASDGPQSAEPSTASELAALREEIAALKTAVEAKRQPRPIDAGTARAAPQPLTKEMLAAMNAKEIAELDWAIVRKVLAG